MKPRVICDAKNRQLWILGDIESFSLRNKAIKFLEKLDIESSQPIKIIISSIGGNFLYCFEIYQTIRNLKSESITIGFKIVDSGAFLIHQGGDERQATRSASFRFHGAILTEENVRKELRKGELSQKRLSEFVQEFERVDAIQLIAFTLRGRPIAQVISLFKTNAVLSAYAAKKFNLVDKVILDKNVPRPPRITHK